jgi:hypothetical protein
LTKFKYAFEPHIYIITKAPKFAKDDEGKTKCENHYIPFKTKDELNKELSDYPKSKQAMIDQEARKKQYKNTNVDKDKILNMYVGENLK